MGDERGTDEVKMAKVIHIKERVGLAPDNVIASSPWEFRWSHWESRYFVQILKSRSQQLERQHREANEGGYGGHVALPPHFVLNGGTANTVRFVFGCRDNEQKMREIYYLAGLIDCMINQINPLLRTDLIKHLYGKVMTMKGLLGINWYGTMDQVLLPLDERLYDHSEYREILAEAGSMKALYRAIREGTDTMFAILSREYVFYTPGRGGHDHVKELR